MGFSVFTVLNNGYLIFFLKVDPFLSFLEFLSDQAVLEREKEKEKEGKTPYLY
jgi:hypothetical protein